ncbi:MAG: hypothetical protein NT067_03100 [Candidatus Diapherotrites archaeon]|nr:hypothetical protein [Candidatus Diapherotrites archaeon]
MPKPEKPRIGWRSAREKALAAWHKRRPLNIKRFSATYKRLVLSRCRDVDAIYGETIRQFGFTKIASSQEIAGTKKAGEPKEYNFKTGISPADAKKAFNYLRASAIRLNASAARIERLGSVLSAEMNICSGKRREEIGRAIDELNLFKEKAMSSTQERLIRLSELNRLIQIMLIEDASRKSKPMAFKVDLPKSLQWK